MALTYTTLQSRVRRVLYDNASTKQIEDEYLQDGIKQAIDHYSKRRPLQKIGTITISSDDREVDISSLTGIIDVSVVWSPYTAGNPEDPPLERPFEYWADQKILYFSYPYRPVSGDVIRVFYQALHTINGLDSETVTTIPLDDESPFVQGCAGYTAQARARINTETVQIDSPVSVSGQVLKWAQTKIAEMDKAIDRTLERELGGASSFVALPKLDRFDRGWS